MKILPPYRTDRRKAFLELCQKTVDVCIAKDIHQLQYGMDLGVIKAQHASAVIAELWHLGALERIGLSDCFSLTPEIYRLYYGRYFEKLIQQEHRDARQTSINVVLAVAAMLSAAAALCGACSQCSREQHDYKNSGGGYELHQKRVPQHDTVTLSSQKLDD